MKHFDEYQLRIGDASFEIADPRLDLEPFPEAPYFELVKAFVADTYACNGFHRRRLDEASVAPDRLRSFADFRRLPLLWSAELKGVPDLTLLPDAYVEGIRAGSLGHLPRGARLMRKFQTTGSTGGAPKASYWTHDDWMANSTSIDRNAAQLPIESYNRVYNCFHGGHFGGRSTEEAYNRKGCVVENSHHTNGTVEDVCRQMYLGLESLGGFNCLNIPPSQPRELRGTKGMTLESLLTVDPDNYIGRKINVIGLGGFPTSPELREQVWEANDRAGRPRATILDKYGTCEVGVVAGTCSQHDGLHIYQGHVYTEIIDPKTGEHVKDGERGLIVMTGLRQGSRWLRYVQGDEATYLSGRCGCGRTAARVKDIKRVLEIDRLSQGCAGGGALALLKQAVEAGKAGKLPA